METGHREDYWPTKVFALANNFLTRGHKLLGVRSRNIALHTCRAQAITEVK